jgi:two-component system NarL family sensor kinase
MANLEQKLPGLNMSAKPWLLFLFLLVLSAGAHAQLNAKDSLYQVLEKLPEDTSKINSYYEFGWLMEPLSLDSALYYYNKGKLISEKYNHVKGKIRFAAIYSSILNEQGKLDKSYEISKEALALCIKNQLYFEMAKTCNNLGNVLNYMGEFDSSMVYFLRSAAIFEKINRTEHLNVIYQNIGGVYLSLGNFEKSVDYTQKAIEYSKLTNDSASISNALTNLAGAYISLKRYDEALVALNNCLDISEKIGNGYAGNMAYLGLGNLYTQTGQYDQAIDVLTKAVTTARKMNYTNNLVNGLDALATVYYKKGNYVLANSYVSEALVINEKYGVYFNLQPQYKLISEVRAKLGQYASAYDYLAKYVALNDSLSGIEHKKSVDELEKKYQTAQKDKQLYENSLKLIENKLRLERNNKRIQKINTWLIVSFSAILILMLILLLVYFMYSNRQKLQEQKMVALKKEQEVIRLKATLDGQLQERQRIAREMHDEIGSGLTTILFLSNHPDIDQAKMVKVSETSKMLINQMNEIIWSMNVEQDQLDDLVSYIRHHSSEMLSTVNIDYRFEIPDQVPELTISGMQRRNIYLVVKESLHNIIKHAGATLVTIKMDFSQGISISIIDNGNGTVEGLENPYGNGMKNMEYRMKQIGGEWSIKSKKPFITELKLKKEQFI